jgi:excisionase family DNA binding protein
MTKLSEHLYTAAAAKYIGVAQNTISKWAARRDIPVHRNPANGYRLFRRDELDAFLKKVSKPVTNTTKKTK